MDRFVAVAPRKDGGIWTCFHDPRRGARNSFHGVIQPLVPPAQVAAFEAQMSKTDVDWQVCVYGGALHAFTNPSANVEGMTYHAAADRRSWKAMLALFDEIF
jgi:dienelactone hydrolase